MVENKQRTAIIVAALLLLGSVSIQFLPEITGFFKEKSVFVQLCSVSSQTSIALAQKISSNYVNVPDYSADVNLRATGAPYKPGDNASLLLSIKDIGITKMKSPYFYILVYSPSNQLRYVFPCFGQEKSDFTPGYSDHYGNIDKFSKWSQWPNNGGYMGDDGRHYTCKENYFLLNFDNLHNCVARLDLTQGKTEGRLIQYNFPVDEPGGWNAYAFVFDEAYTSRKNVYLSQYGSEAQNAVSYFLAKFDVVSAPQKSITILDILPYAIYAAISIGGYYFVLKDCYKAIANLWKNYGKKIIIFIVCVGILSVVMWLFYKNFCNA